MKSWLSKDIFEKPEDWPCNEREAYLERVKNAIIAFEEALDQRR